jgi:hypothetical protein
VSSAHSSTLYVLLNLCTVCHVHLLHHSSVVHFFCCVLTPSSLVYSISQQQPLSSFLLHSYNLCAPCASPLLLSPACSTPPANVHHIGVFTTTFTIPPPHSCAPHCVSVLHLLLLLSALPDHHGNSSASLAVSHASIITGCYTEIPQLLWQLRLFIFSVIDELILWKKPSVVSNSYTLECNSSPPILFKFICTIAPLWLPQPRLVKPLVHTTCFYMTIRQFLVGVSEFVVPQCTRTRNSRSSDPRCAPSVLAFRAKSWSIRLQRSQDHSLNSCRGLAPFHVMMHKSPGLSARLYTS